MLSKTKNIIPFLLPILALIMLSGCYDMSVQIASLPGNTPPAEPIYISGNFNNWDPGDPKYILKPNKDSVLEVQLPKGIGEIEFKFTRGDWSTVEKDSCGFEINNRSAFYGKTKVLQASVLSWNDLPKTACPSLLLIIDSLPANTPPNAVLYLAANFNNWSPGSRYWMFSRDTDGRYFIDIPRVKVDGIEFKITRGDWGRVECKPNGEDYENRKLPELVGREVHISIEAWKDLYDWKESVNQENN